MKKRFMGYKIIQSISIYNVTFYLGYNKHDKKPYATFFKRNELNEYAWLRLFDDLFEAQKDMVTRAFHEIPSLEHNKKSWEDNYGK